MRIEGWQRNLIALWIAQVLGMMAFSAYFPFIPLYVKVLGVQGDTAAIQWAGAITASGAVAMAIVQPIWGNLADRWGSKPMVVRAMVGNGVLALLMGVAASPEQLLALRVIQGSLTGSVTASNVLIGASAPKHRVGFALGVMQVAYFLGTSVGPMMGGMIADALGYRAAFFAASALGLAGVPLVLGFVREDRSTISTRIPNRGAWSESRALLALNFLPVMVAVVFLVQLAAVIVMPVLSVFVEELSRGENAATMAGIILAASGAISAVSAVSIGRLSDRVGHSKVLAVCLLGAAVSCFPQAFVHQTWDLLWLRMLQGVFLGGLMPAANALIVGLVPPERRGSAFGLTATGLALANAIGPLSGAAVASLWGMRAVFLVTGALFALAFGWVGLASRKIRPMRPRPGAEVIWREPPASIGTGRNSQE